VIQECLELAIQAPNGGNQNRYHFVVVTDPAKRAAIGAIYRRPSTRSTCHYRARGTPPARIPEALGEHTRLRELLADHMGEVPVHIIPCVESRFENAEPFGVTRWEHLAGTWSLMLALRSAASARRGRLSISITRKRWRPFLDS
jgi:nitroreductase